MGYPFKDDFNYSGPKHVTARNIDWSSEEHRRCITACLVKGAYVLESDRSNGRLGALSALAPPWWGSFGFRLLRPLSCPCRCRNCDCEDMYSISNGFIYGAVLEYAHPLHHPSSAPRYVVAFRGTIKLRLKLETLTNPAPWGDAVSDIKILLNQQHLCGRFQDARGQVGELLRCSGSPPGAVWLAGHSLGASVALDVGRDLAKEGCYLPAFLFNPPQVSLAPALRKLGMEKAARRDLYALSDAAKHLLANTAPMRGQMESMTALFRQLAPWAPNLYVHGGDGFCNGFIDYFERREDMRRWFPEAASTSTAISYRDTLWYSLLGKETERPHLLPSAVLWRNNRRSSSINPHALQQWWQPLGPEELSVQEYNWP